MCLNPICYYPDLIAKAAITLNRLTDENVKEALKSGSRIKATKIILKDHKKAILTLMATLEETPVEEYKPTLLALPALIIEVLNDPELNSLF